MIIHDQSESNFGHDQSLYIIGLQNPITRGGGHLSQAVSVSGQGHEGVS